MVLSALELALATVRGIHIALTLLAFGLLVFATLIRRVRPAIAPVPPRLRKAAALAALAAALSGLPWLLAQAAVFAGARTLPAALAAVPATLGTRFGHVLVPQLALLLITGVLCLKGRPALLAATLALALHALVGHLAVELNEAQAPFLLAQAGHLLAAGAWLGGMVGLLLAAPLLAPKILGHVSKAFSPLGTACVAVLAFSALLNGYALVGGLGALLGTPYGRLALAKTALFALMLGLAALNRWRITPRLSVGDGKAPARLVRSVILELAVGLGVVALASGLASSIPGVHDQPWWPWARRWSAATLADPDLGPDAWRALLLSSAGLLLLALALLPVRPLRSWRRAVPVVLAGLAFWQGTPDLDLLTVEAFPTSFWSSPSGFTAASIAQGASLFPQHCAACHGANGAGDGPQAQSLPVPPADLTAGHLLDHSDGDLFWWLSHGMPGPDGSPVMPAFANSLSEDDIWSLIDYIHAHNAGANLATDANRWTRAMAPPDLPLSCADNPAISGLGDLAGRSFLVVMGQDPATLPASAVNTLDDAGLTVVAGVAADAAMVPTPKGVCLAPSNEALGAYETITGLKAPFMVLVDERGALRQAWAGGLTSTTSPLIAAAQDAEDHPFATTSGGHHHH